jgi:hypothetical protein
MAAQIPIKDDPKANDAAMENVRADKLREVRAGHDGTWVAHPTLAAIASDVFNKYMPTPNQLFNRREDVHVTANDLLNTNVPGSITEDGIRKNLNIGLSYMEGWLRGVGCIPINFLMVCYLPRPAIDVVLIVLCRRTPRPLKSPEASCGNGCDTTSPRLRANALTRHMLSVCYRSSPTPLRRSRRRETSSSSPRGTSRRRSRARTMRTS